MAVHGFSSQTLKKRKSICWSAFHLELHRLFFFFKAVINITSVSTITEMESQSGLWFLATVPTLLTANPKQFLGPHKVFCGWKKKPKWVELAAVYKQIRFSVYIQIFDISCHSTPALRRQTAPVEQLGICNWIWCKSWDADSNCSIVCLIFDLKST